jgi:hypothetical protein
MELVVLSVPDCPNVALLDEQLAVLLTGRDDVQAVHLDEGIKLAAQTFTHEAVLLRLLIGRE